MTAWIILKVLHVFGGVVWMGMGITIVFFIAPAVSATAPAGGAVMGHLSDKLKMPDVLSYSAWLATLTGLPLYWRATAGLDPAYLGTFPVQALTVGVLAGLVAFVLAVFVQIPRSKRIGQLSREAGPNPSEEQARVIQGEQRKFKLGGHVVMLMFLITLLGMILSHPL